ncbi:hypothetical protein NUW58_g7304 [Xylaria curta]|uniref:Uncharacterized protein n=1 Tax=Xylaria curta TaxID=42375 RepID=A0ACC1NIZ9_9PEZI|nr:hypothetical protein NUW58_g7304 [Xylaria curta]
MASFDFKSYLQSIDTASSYEVAKLSGGLVNLTVRASKTTASDLGTFPGTCSLVLKYAPPFVAMVGPEAPFSQARQEAETSALKLFHDEGPLHAPHEQACIRIPKVLHHDVGSSVHIIEDLESSGRGVNGDIAQFLASLRCHWLYLEALLECLGNDSETSPKASSIRKALAATQAFVQGICTKYVELSNSTFAPAVVAQRLRFAVILFSRETINQAYEIEWDIEGYAISKDDSRNKMMAAGADYLTKRGESASEALDTWSNDDASILLLSWIVSSLAAFHPTYLRITLFGTLQASSTNQRWHREGEVHDGRDQVDYTIDRTLDMSKPWIFVSPSSRGIGHALTAHLLRCTSLPILVTARSDLSGVKDSLVAASSHGTQMNREDNASRLHVTYLDVTDESSVEAASAKAAELFPPSSHHLHLAFALPGILHPEKQPRQVDYDNALETFKVNTLGPLMLMKWFGDLLPRKGTDLSYVQALAAGGNPNTNSSMNGGEHEGPRDQFRIPLHATWLTNSARVGSTSDNRLGGWYSYRASKAGVNSITKSFDLHLRTRSADKAMALAYHPGTVKTEFSKEFWGNVAGDKLFSPAFAVQKMLAVVESRTMEDRGRCWDWKGEEILS